MNLKMHEERLERIDKWIERGILTFIIFLPIISPVSYLSLLFTTFLFIYKLKLDRSFLKEIPLNLWMLILAFCVFLSVIFSTHKLFSLGAFILFIFYLITYFIFANSPLNEKRILNAILISGLIVTVFGVIQYLTSFNFKYHLSLLNINIDISAEAGIESTLGKPNRFAKYLVLITPFAFISLLNKKKVIFSSLVILLLLICVFLTRSLGGIGAMIIVLMAILLFKNWKIFLIPVFIFSIIGSEWLVEKYTSRISINERIYTWRKVAIPIFKDYPLTGCGLSTYVKVSHNYGEGEKRLNSHAHNLYFNYLAETGILGLGSFLLLMAMFFYYSIAHLKKNAFYSSKGLIAGGIFGIFGSLIAGISEPVIDGIQIGLFFFSIMGITMGLINRR